jgi:hypothetical protein
MPTAAAETVALLERLHAVLPLPRVAALLLPPPAADGSKDGEFGAIELDDGSTGLTFVLLGDTLATLRGGGGARVLAGTPAIDVARQYANARGAERALGFAAVNALTRHLCDRAGFVPPPATGSLGDLELAPGDHVGMVGLFPPLVPQVLASGARLTVVELRPELAGPRDGWEVTLDADALRRCNKILSTSTVLLNDTLDDMLVRCAGATRLALIGPGAGCLPDAMFARGVTLMGGSWVADGPSFRQALLAGDRWGRFAPKFALARDAYPGFDALLARALAAHG